MYKAGVALNRKSVFPLFSTTKVCRERKKGRKKEKERERVNAWKSKHEQHKEKTNNFYGKENPVFSVFLNDNLL